MTARVSVIVPSKGCTFLRYLLHGLREQSVAPYEVILVLKHCNMAYVEKICRSYNLHCILIEQREGFVTRALNIGKKESRGDVIVFTDEDAIPPARWIKRWIDLHQKYKHIAGISSRDIYLSLDRLELRPTPDDFIHVRLYRLFIRMLFERPHPSLERYKMGVYITHDYKIGHGPYIPYRECYSLPLRGVNMSFKREYIDDILFLEHPLLRRYLGFEQHFGLQILLKGFDMIYTPKNPILHIMRGESLSRTKSGKSIKTELRIMRLLYARLLEERKGIG